METEFYTYRLTERKHGPKYKLEVFANYAIDGKHNGGPYLVWSKDCYVNQRDSAESQARERGMLPFNPGPYLPAS